MSMTIRLLLVLMFCLALLAPESAAWAQDVGTQPAATVAGQSDGSFAGAFFVSRKTDPATGEKSIEILGSLIIWFLLLLSFLSVGLIGHAALSNQRKSILPDGMVEEAHGMLQSGKHRELMDLLGNDQSFFSRILHAGLSDAPHGYSSVIRSLEQTSDELTTDRLRQVEYLNVLGQVSPMIGLFGTVYGMILAFHAIVVAGGSANPVLLATGIGTALTTTFWGLVVAIPALAGYAIVRNKIDSLTTEATLVAEELLNQFRPKSRKHPSDPQS